MSITTRVDRGVTCYEHGGGRCCLSVGGDRSVIRPSDLGQKNLVTGKISRRERPWSGRKQLRDGRVFRTEDDFGKVECGED